jgi:integrase
MTTTTLPAIHLGRSSDLANVGQPAPGDALTAVADTFAALKVNTRASYNRARELFERVTNRPVQDATPRSVQLFIDHLTIDGNGGKGYKPAAFNAYLRWLSAVMKIHHECGTRQDNPVELLNRRATIFKPTPEKGARLKISLADCRKLKSTGRMNDHTGLFIDALFDTGARVSELINARIENIRDVNENGTPVKRILLTETKTGRDREVDVFPPLYDAIRQAYSVKDSPYLFHATKGIHAGGTLHRANVYRQIRSRFKTRLGIDRVGAHQLRHLKATTMIGENQEHLVDASKYLGHASISTTVDIYTHRRASASLVMATRI